MFSVMWKTTKKTYSPIDDDERKDQKQPTVSTRKCLRQENKSKLTQKTDFIFLTLTSSHWLACYLSSMCWLTEARNSKNDLSTLSSGTVHAGTINVYRYFSEHEDTRDSDKQWLDPHGQKCVIDMAREREADEFSFWDSLYLRISFLFDRDIISAASFPTVRVRVFCLHCCECQ